MEQHHRDLIQKNYSNLVQHCNIDLLLPGLVNKKIFSAQMITKYMKGDALKRKRDLFIDIQMRGPRAFAMLIEALRETHQYNLANLLQPIANNHSETSRKHAKPFLLPVNEEIQTFDPEDIQHIGQSHNGNVNLGTEPLRINVKPATKLYDDPAQNEEPVYSTHSKNRGYVLIINNIKYANDIHTERRGAEVDGRNLEELFSQMGLRIESHVDLTAAQMQQVVHNFKTSPKIKGIDMVFIIIMSHGNQNADMMATEIVGIDNEIVTTAWIEEQFDNVHCKALQKIPKIFVYQTCRGKIMDYGVAVQTEHDSAANISMRTRSDMFIGYSTLPGAVSHRDIYLGTWYINIFCDTMMNKAHKVDVENIFKILDSNLSHLRTSKYTMQTSVFTNVGFKTCFIHPTIYEENGQILKLPHVLPDELR